MTLDSFKIEQGHKKDIPLFYDYNFFNNIRYLMGYFNHYKGKGLATVFDQYKVFEDVILLCRASNKKLISDELFNKFMGVLHGSNSFVYDVKDKDSNFIPLFKLKPLQRTFIGFDDTTPNAEKVLDLTIHFHGFKYKVDGNVYTTDELQPVEWSTLLDNTLQRLNPVAVKIELLIQKDLEKNMIPSYLDDDGDEDRGLL